MARKKELGKRRILIYYLLAIVFPCIILGVLAFRGILNDQALVEKENRRNLLDISSNIAEKSFQSIELLETEFRSFIKAKSSSFQEFNQDSSYLTFIDKNDLLNQICLQDENSKISCQNSRLLYLPFELHDFATQDLSSEASILIQNGWKYEFQEKNYSRALDYYQEALKNLRVKQDKANILNILARLHKKNGTNQLALSTYNVLYEEYSNTYILNNIPLSLVSQREILKIYKLNNDKEGIIQTTNLIVDNLSNSKTAITKSHFENTIAEIKDALIELDSTPSFISQKLGEIQKLKEETEYIINFIDESDNAYSNDKVSKNKSEKYNLTIRGDDYYISQIPGKDKNWILIYDRKKILDSLLTPMLKTEKIIEKTNWQVKGSQDSILKKFGNVSEDAIPISYQFPSHLPNWMIEYFPIPKNLISSFLTLGGGLYFYILLFILVFLAFGLLFTLHSINQELRLSKMKSNFISTVSHEFKSPLTSIRQMAEMLEAGRIPSEQRRKAYYKNILNQSERLTHLIENILDFARMEEGRKRYHFEKNDVVETLGKIINDLRFQVDNNGFEILFEVENDVPQIIFDKDSIEQVIHNLLDNAVKYSGDSKKIEVKLKDEKEFIRISIKDFGVGIPKADQEKIFDRFYRVGDELTGRVKGTGIGLTIVKQIIDKHKGQISLESQVNKGSTFHVLLPKSTKI